MRATARLMAGSSTPRLHLEDGPIDLILLAEGTADAVNTAYHAAARGFATVLDQLCAELPLLRAQVTPDALWPVDPIARRMRAAVSPFTRFGFITPMAAVAGAVAETMLAIMTEAAPLSRACVNNGGDIAVYLGPRQSLTVGMVPRPELPGRRGPDLFGSLTIGHADGIRGIATSGWQGRSFSRGIADAVTVLALTAAAADAAATVIANAVDLPRHPNILRRPASTIQPDSDLGNILVTCRVGPLSPSEINEALARGLCCAEVLAEEGEIAAAALHLGGHTLATSMLPQTSIPQFVARMAEAHG
jgi:uncharacterized protein